MVDLFQNLNELNLRLQGRENPICGLKNTKSAFQNKVGQLFNNSEGKHFISLP
jgi:hypothetical protein